MLKLYHAPFSPCAQKVRLLIAEKGLEWTSREIDLVAKENLEPWYLEIAPKGLVPVLDHDGVVVSESSLICEYLEDAFPAAPLRPDTAADKMIARAWMKLVDEVLHAHAGPIIFGSLMRHWLMQVPAEERERRLAKVMDPARRQRQQAALERGLDVPAVETSLIAWSGALAQLEHRLEERTWLAGDRYSIADAAVTPYVFYMDALGMSLAFERHPAVARWYERVRSRPSFQQAIVEAAPESEWETLRTVSRKSGPVLNDRLRALTA